MSDTNELRAAQGDEKRAKASAWDSLRASCVLRDVQVTIGDIIDTMGRLLAERGFPQAWPQQEAPSAQPVAPEQVRDGIADWIETNIQHREFWTPEVVELIRSIEISPSAIGTQPTATKGTK